MSGNRKSHSVVKYQYIVLEGNIGAGKTTLASKLASHFMADLIEEQFDENPLLPAFYKSPKEFAYPLEVSFLLDRFRDLKRSLLPGRKVIADYWFNKSLIFAKTNLNKEQQVAFSNLFLQLEALLPVPDLIIYYHRNTNKIRESISQRGRGYEQAIPDAYLLKLEKNYMSGLKKVKNTPVLWLEGDRFQPGRNRDHFRLLLDLLDQAFKPGLNKPEIAL